MSISRYEKLVREIFARVGIEIDGPAPHDIQVHHRGFYRRVLSQGSQGLGESYMDGWWDAQAVDAFIARIIANGIEEQIRPSAHLVAYVLASHLHNRQNRQRARHSVEAHYDLGNDLFERMLDPLMNYSCGYWAEAQDLNSAQRNKLDLVCRKLGLREGQRVIDIGCGWGGFARYAAEQYGVEVLGITLSKEQAALARERCRDLPVEIELCDYRDLDQQADRIVSIGMFEHVGHRNYKTFMQVIERCLRKDGLALLHTIGNVRTTRDNEPWIDKYIFPDGEIPSITQIGEAMEEHLIMEDWHNFGPDYDRTLMAWLHNFENAWPELSCNGHYDERFYRMWRYYLMFCAGLFRARRLQLWQVVLAPHGRPGVYRSLR